MSNRSALRSVALWLHRYVGLAMTAFLVVAGLTGTVLVFFEELDAAINPELTRVSTSAEPLDPFEVVRRVQARPPNEIAWAVQFVTEPGHSLQVWQRSDDGRHRQRFIDPSTGAMLGERTWGDIREGLVNLMPFVYRLHYSLALGDVGVFLFGMVALLWTFDIFLGAYLTFPVAGPKEARTGAWLWLKRWAPAWLIRSHRLFAWVFTWHRASGLWLWALLLVFAWSGVGLNLSTVYQPLMSATFGMQEHVRDQLPKAPEPYGPSAFTPEQAHVKARQLMLRELGQRNAELQREMYIEYVPEQRTIVYRVQSSLDVSSRYPQTQVYMDAQSGALLGFHAATGEAAGNTITNWLYALHFASVGGWAYRLVVAVTGLLVAILSVTGVWIWLRKGQKRAARETRTSTAITPTAQLESSV